MAAKKWFICLKYKLIINRVFTSYFAVKVFRSYNSEKGILSSLWSLDHSIWPPALLLQTAVLCVKTNVYANIPILPIVINPIIMRNTQLIPMSWKAFLKHSRCPSHTWDALYVGERVPLHRNLSVLVLSPGWQCYNVSIYLLRTELNPSIHFA